MKFFHTLVVSCHAHSRWFQDHPTADEEWIPVAIFHPKIEEDEVQTNMYARKPRIAVSDP